MTLFRRDRDAIHRLGESTGVCDGCGHTFPTGDLAWRVVSWEARARDLGRRTLDIGEFTALLCEKCGAFGWSMCWRCGAVARDPDLCDRCAGEVR